MARLSSEPYALTLDVRWSLYSLAASGAEETRLKAGEEGAEDDVAGIPEAADEVDARGCDCN